MLRAHHVVVGVFRETRVQAVARLARLAVTDAVGQDDEVPRGVERLSGAEQLAAERRATESLHRSAGAVQNHHRVAHDAARVAPRRADRPVMQLQRGQRFAGPELEIAQREVAFNGRRKCPRRLSARGRRNEQRERRNRPRFGDFSCCFLLLTIREIGSHYDVITRAASHRKNACFIPSFARVLLSLTAVCAILIRRRHRRRRTPSDVACRFRTSCPGRSSRSSRPTAASSSTFRATPTGRRTASSGICGARTPPAAARFV